MKTNERKLFLNAELAAGAGRGGAGVHRQGGGRRGFTIFELLIVISILVILVGILVPTLSRVRDSGRKAATQALMSNLQSDIDAYFQYFHAYPGPMSAAVTTGGTGSKMSGAQNMLYGLSYALGTTTVPPSGSPPFLPPSMIPAGPIDYANLSPLGQYQQVSPYFSPKASELFVSNANSFAFPVVVDTFSDGLPILYYRRTTGVESIPIVGVASGGAPSSYYFNENIEYTGQSGAGKMLASTSGTPYYQNGASGGGTSVFGPNELTTLVSNGSSVRGQYVLISAGIDRYYGTYKGKTDDIVVVGGD